MWLSEQNVSQAEGIEHANVFFLKHFIKLFMRDTERGRDIGRGRGRLLAGSLMLDGIPRPQDHNLSQR